MHRTKAFFVTRQLQGTSADPLEWIDGIDDVQHRKVLRYFQTTQSAPQNFWIFLHFSNFPHDRDEVAKQYVSGDRRMFGTGNGSGANDGRSSSQCYCVYLDWQFGRFFLKLMLKWLGS